MNRRETTYLLTTDIIDASIHITCTALRHSRCINKSIIFKIQYICLKHFRTTLDWMLNVIICWNKVIIQRELVETYFHQHSILHKLHNFIDKYPIQYKRMKKKAKGNSLNDMYIKHIHRAIYIDIGIITIAIYETS